MAYGTLQIFDTIGAKKAAYNQFIQAYDEATLYQQLEIFLQAHNRLLMMMMDDFTEPTQDRFMTWGSNDTVDVIEGDEFSRPDVQKTAPAPTIMGFPMRLRQIAWGVTRMFMQTKTIGDLEQVATAIMDADKRDLSRSIRATLFNPLNNPTYVDRYLDGATYPVRALLNADGVYIKPDMYGNKFNPATHTHFLGATTAGTVADADVQALLGTVLEHYAYGTPIIYINRAQEVAFRGLTTTSVKFYPYADPRVTFGYNNDRALGKTLDNMDIYNRPIGIYQQSEVWIKPWVPAGYMFCFNPAAPKPLRLRTRNAQRGDLHVAADIDMYPLRAQFMEREYGLGVFERTNGACLCTTATTYAAPAAWTF